MDRMGRFEDLPRFLTETEVARLARVPTDRVRRWRKRRLLPGVRPPGTRQVLYPREQVIDWLRGEGRRP
jgi:excisionase family DNA binding protein